MQNISLDQLNYEQAFAELEQIVNRLESETLNLDESLTLYERGQSLSAHCAGLLESAELRVQQIRLENQLPKNEQDD